MKTFVERYRDTIEKQKMQIEEEARILALKNDDSDAVWKGLRKTGDMTLEGIDTGLGQNLVQVDSLNEIVEVDNSFEQDLSFASSIEGIDAQLKNEAYTLRQSQAEVKLEKRSQFLGLIKTCNGTHSMIYIM